MARILLVAVTVVGIATAASAGTLTVFTTDLADVPKNTFAVGETFLLKVTGDTEGDSTNVGIQGQLAWDPALTTTVDATQGSWQNDHGSLFPSDGSVFAFNQCCHGTAVRIIDTSVITLTADAIGATQVTWGGTLLQFFGVYSYNDGDPISVPTGHSFTIVPEPATAALIGLGALGIAIGMRRRI